MLRSVPRRFPPGSAGFSWGWALVSIQAKALQASSEPLRGSFYRSCGPRQGAGESPLSPFLIRDQHARKRRNGGVRSEGFSGCFADHGRLWKPPARLSNRIPRASMQGAAKRTVIPGFDPSPSKLERHETEGSPGPVDGLTKGRPSPFPLGSVRRDACQRRGADPASAGQSSPALSLKGKA